MKRTSLLILLLLSLVLYTQSQTVDILPSSLGVTHSGEDDITELYYNDMTWPDFNIPSTDGGMAIDKNDSLAISNWDVIGHLEPISNIELLIEYSVEFNYSGSNSIFAGGFDTGITPMDPQTDQTASFNLFAVGITTWEQVADLAISFYNNDSGTGGPQAISIDYLWIRVTLDCDLGLNAYELIDNTCIGTCNGSSVVEVSAGVPPYTYLWSNLMSQTTPQADSLCGGEYYVTVTDSVGCYDVDTVSIQEFNVWQDEELCLVTVDPTIGKNKVMWEKSMGVGTSFFNVYKEVEVGLFDVIGTVPIDSLSYYMDWSSNPAAHGDKYKISAVDTCGNESEMSFFHRTMNLGLSNVGSTMYLDWEPYEDESGLFSPLKYYIYRGQTPYDLTLIDSISASFTSYNDIGVYDVYFYMIGVKRETPCILTGVEQSYSNLKDNEELITSMREADPNFGKVKVYPNPFSDHTTIEFDKDEFEYLILMDITGKELRRYDDLSDGRIVIERSGLAKGMYYVQLQGENPVSVKLVVE